MNRNCYAHLLAFSMLTLTLGPRAEAAAQNSAAAYPQMAPMDRYLMTPSSEIALAQSAAPSAISHNATVMILSRDGYQTVAKGTNGFTCLVERAWMSAFDSPEFWNPKMRGPICYNQPASRTVLLYTINRTELVVRGLSKAQMLEQIEAAFAAKRLPLPEPGSMSYMMSKGGYLGDGVGSWHPHLMFHAPKADGARDGASWGADLPGSPVILDTSYHQIPEPETIFMVTVAKWSDGTPARHTSHTM
jgi:hypothetical protein